MRITGCLTVARVFLPIYMLAFTPVLFQASGQTERQREALPKSFDSPFAPQNINPDIAVISPTPGFEHGRYDVRMGLSETTLYDQSSKPTRNYVGDFVLQSVKLPTDDFAQLAGKYFPDITDDLSSSWIEFRQIPAGGEVVQRPFEQQYPVLIKSVRFGPHHRYVVFVELAFEVDFSVAGPPSPWAKRAAISPYHLAASPDNPGYPQEDWNAFRKLVQETRLLWSKAKYATNVRVLLNHEYQSSSGMNTHER
jgi:hypothetical protein